MWNIRRIVSKGDYNYAVVPEHPKAIKRGYVLEHRVVMENAIGRILRDDEIVHHINGIKKDNREENLEIMLLSDHSRHHSSTGRTVVSLICPNCMKAFSIEKREVRAKKAPKCSRRCNGQYSRLIQMNLICEI